MTLSQALCHLYLQGLSSRRLRGYGLLKCRDITHGRESWLLRLVLPIGL